ncbi:helix-turn-helix transcriptional regulator [uncultured Deinococcus sp.]|uniref:helix-turn-helix domain-containing protein n=1 Tax=uncultured Deinococcus sp. TaxID=158789 RepID=UPI00338D4064
MVALKMNQSELARKSTLSPQYISDLLSGKRGARMSVVTLTQLARALRVPPSRLTEAVANPDSSSTGTDRRKALARA